MSLSPRQNGLTAQLPSGVPVRRAHGDRWPDYLPVARANASHLHALYQKHLGISPMQSVISQRIQRARELLVTARHSVKEISYRVGFLHVTHFCRTFRARVGMSPNEYRLR